LESCGDGGYPSRGADARCGKIAIPDEFLLKQGSLTSTEFDVVKRHTTIGAEMLTGSRVSTIQMAESIVLSPHEP
jgi:putative two-component system response regulator